MRWRRPKIDLHKSPEHTAARRAVAAATSDLRESKERGEEIAAEVAKATKYGDRNNFAEMIREALGGTQ